MLAPAKLQQLHALIEQSTSEEWLWMSGYLAGLARGNDAAQLPPASNKATANGTITVLYGTETGNSKKVATTLAGKLKQAGRKTKLVAAEQYKPQQLSTEETVLIAISTQGEGEPPANAKALYDYLHQLQTPLQGLQYAVVALGSKSYPLFCQAGIDVDAQLKRLQATAIAPIALCDDDYEPVADAWMSNVLTALQQQAPVAKPAAAVVSVQSSGKKTFTATLGVNQLLNDTGSNKKVHHLEFDLPEELVYLPGNAVGITPHNSASVVAQIIQLLQVNPDAVFSFKQQTASAKHLLTQVVSITHLTTAVVKKYAQLIQTDIPDTRIDLFDLLRIYPWPSEFAPQQLFDILNPITPRLYTISSSPNTHPGQIHLTAALHEFDTEEGSKHGFGSTYVTQLKPGTKVDMFLHQQKHFQIPRSDRHLIMLAYGTGIAPFRSMVAERDATGASGKNWLLFAEENRVTDFYYQSEWQSLHETGSLHQWHVGFSTNTQQQKSLSQLVLEHEEQLWQWLNSGAYVFISGEKAVAGKPVEEALLQLIARKQQSSEEAAANYLKELAKEGRYAKELY